jgi:hypothetical protein
VISQPSAPSGSDSLPGKMSLAITPTIKPTKSCQIMDIFLSFSLMLMEQNETAE